MTVFQESRVGRAWAWVWARVDAAIAASWLLRIARQTGERSRQRVLEDAIAFGSIVLTVAMIVHVALLSFDEPYPFPGRAHFIVPICLLVLGLAGMTGRKVLAAAWRDKRSH